MIGESSGLSVAYSKLNASASQPSVIRIPSASHSKASRPCSRRGRTRRHINRKVCCCAHHSNFENTLQIAAIKSCVRDRSSYLPQQSVNQKALLARQAEGRGRSQLTSQTEEDLMTSNPVIKTYPFSNNKNSLGEGGWGNEARVVGCQGLPRVLIKHRERLHVVLT